MQMGLGIGLRRRRASGGGGGGAYSVTIGEGTASAVASGADLIVTVSGHSTTAYNGEWTVTGGVADIEANKPIAIVGPFSSLTTLTFTVTPTLYGYPDGEVPEVTMSMVRNSYATVATAAAALSYTMANDGDETMGHVYTDIATNDYGTATASVTCQAEPSYTENEVSLSGGADQTYTGTLVATPQPTMTFLIRGKVESFAARQFLYSFHSSRNYIRLETSGEFSFAIRSTNNEVLLAGGDASTMSVNDYFTLLVSCETGTSINNRAYLKVNSDDWFQLRIENKTSTGNIEMNDTNAFLHTGAFGNNWTGNILGQSFRTTATRPDITLSSVRDLFVNADGTLKNPSMANYELGTPVVEMFGNAAAYGAGTNTGSGPNFTAAGTYTDV